MRGFRCFCPLSSRLLTFGLRGQAGIDRHREACFHDDAKLALCLMLYLSGIMKLRAHLRGPYSKEEVHFNAASLFIHDTP